MKRIISVIFLILLISISSGQDHKVLFQDANRLYLDGNYEEALDRYLQIENYGKLSGELLYNIGNTYFKLNNIGKSILYFERASKYIPGDEDLQNNLALANLNTVDKITPIPELFYIKYWKSFRNLFSLNGWGFVFLSSYFIIIFLIILRMFLKNIRTAIFIKRILYVSTAISILILLSIGSILYQDETTDEAVVMSEVIPVFSTPSVDGTELFTIHEGTKILILEESGTWVEIKLPDGKVGWLERKAIEII